jgi:hypothetical protein
LGLTRTNVTCGIRSAGEIHRRVYAPMFGRIRGTAIALGLIVALPAALAQERIEPALESQPMPSPGQQESDRASQQDTAPAQVRPSDLLPGIQGIEAAIRDLIAEDDEIARQRQENREVRDLEAQEDMALWAMWMFFATLATVIVTVIGVCLIFRTLKYTKEAAIYAKIAAEAAKETVAEARNSNTVTTRAVTAAVDANTINRNAMIIGNRAWVVPDGLTFLAPLRWQGRSANTSIRCDFLNTGRTAAYFANLTLRFAVGGYKDVEPLYQQMATSAKEHIRTDGEIIIPDRKIQKTWRERGRC